MIKEVTNEIEEFSLNVEAQTPLVQIVSHETLRIRALCNRVAKGLDNPFIVGIVFTVCDYTRKVGSCRRIRNSLMNFGLDSRNIR